MTTDIKTLQALPIVELLVQALEMGCPEDPHSIESQAIEAGRALIAQMQRDAKTVPVEWEDFSRARDAEMQRDEPMQPAGPEDQAVYDAIAARYKRDAVQPVTWLIKEALEATFEQRPGHLKLVAAAVRALGDAAPHPEAQDTRTCTCHPDDNPPKPCPRKFALSECREVQALDSQRQPPDDVGGLEYRGNSVSFIHSKMTAYRTAIDEAWAAMRECGHPPDGKTRLADAIRALAAQQQDDHARPVTVQEDRVLRNAALRSSTLVAKGKLVDSQQQDDHAGSPAPSALPLFAVAVAQRKWEILQADGYRMQRIEFARSIDGQETRGIIDPWGRVLWKYGQAESSKAALSDEEIKAAAKQAGFLFHTIPEYAPIQHTLPEEFSERCFYRFARAILARAGITRKPLTEEEIMDICKETSMLMWDEVDGYSIRGFARAIEAAHGITPQAGKESGE